VVTRELEPVHPAVPQLVDVLADGVVLAVRQPRAGDPQRQRQVPAQPRELLGGVRFGVELCAAGLPEHVDRGGRRQHVERDAARPVERDEAAEPIAAGGQDEAARLTGQQRADLLGIGDVVEHHQDPPAGDE
jgi:hypothetical protein